MSLVADLAKILFCSLFLGNSHAEILPRLNFLIISDSISSTCANQQHGVLQSVFQISEANPGVVVHRGRGLAECDAQFIWESLGRMLIEHKHALTVEFTSLNVKDAKLSGLTGNGPPEMSLSTTIDSMRRSNLRFDAILFQQGPGDIGQTSRTYRNEFNNLVILFINANIISPWLIARHSRCKDLPNSEIDLVQKTLPADFFTKFYFAGPNINLIEERNASNGCSLNQTGEHRAATLWLQAYEAHLQLLRRAKREALLFFP